MATVKAANVTKYDAGGSGDNIVDNGYIKSVEKVWIDNYAITTIIPSTTSLLIARIPKESKVTEIIVHVPVIHTVSGSTNKVYCCTGATTSAVTYFGTLSKGDQAGLRFETVTACTLRLSATDTRKFQPVPKDVGIYLTFDPDTSVSGGTLRTIVKYT
jgi:hypothetical protein